VVGLRRPLGVSTARATGVPAPTGGEPGDGCGLVVELNVGSTTMVLASLPVTACQAASVGRSARTLTRLPDIAKREEVPLVKKSLKLLVKLVKGGVELMPMA
jgi:hypothetical protein